MGLENAGVRGKRSSLKIAKGSCEGRNGVSGRKSRREEESVKDEGEKEERVEGGRAGGRECRGHFYFFLVGILGLTFGGWFLYRMNDELDSYMGESLIWELFLI